MTEPQKKHTLDDFRKPRQDDLDEDWTQDEILEAAKRIIKDIGIDGEITDPDEGAR